MTAKVYTHPNSVDRAEARGQLTARIADEIRLLIAAFPSRAVRVLNGEIL